MTTRKGLRVCVTGPRDLQVMLNLRKWKVSTTLTLTAKFFPGIAPATAYRRLWTLAKGGLIQSRYDKAGLKHVWLLADRGYGVVKQNLPFTFEEDGYKSEHVGHDLAAAAFQQGDWTPKTPPGEKFYTDQQLRRLQPKDMPACVPHSDVHRADGFIYVPKGDDGWVVAIEAELNCKRPRDYEAHHIAYWEKEIDQVLWLVSKTGFVKTIGDGADFYRQRSRNVHSFILVGDFMSQSWSATIFSGLDKGKTVGESMVQHLHNNPTTVPRYVLMRLSLNTSKTTHRSKGCRMYALGDFGN